MGKQPEKKTLGIISITIGVIALLLSWSPNSNEFAAGLTIISIIIGIVALIINWKHKKLLSWIGIVFSIIVFSISAMVQSTHEKTISNNNSSISNSTASSVKNNSKKASHENKILDSKFTFKDNTFNADQLSYKITGTEVTPGANGTRVLVFFIDATNNSDKNISPTDLSMYMHVYQNTDNSKDQLNPGTIDTMNGGDQAALEKGNNILNDILPGKTVQIAKSVELKNDNDVKVEFLDDDLTTIVGEKNYQVR